MALPPIFPPFAYQPRTPYPLALSAYGNQMAGVPPGKPIMGPLVRFGMRFAAIPVLFDRGRTFDPYGLRWPTVPSITPPPPPPP